jgi:hypothetical protein
MTGLLTRPQTTACVSLGAERVLRALGYGVLSEVTLRSGRRADLMGLGPSGEIVIVEVKSGIEDFRTDAKWPTYAPFCDRLFFAVDEAFPHSVLPETEGLIVADRHGGAVVREAPLRALAPARRKAMTLAFARLAAARLNPDASFDPWVG